jgi:hypothetical protein
LGDALVGAVVGAIIGGAITLVGSVIVGRWELANAARLRAFEELLPKIMDKSLSIPQHSDATSDDLQLDTDLRALARVAAIAGRTEYRTMQRIGKMWAARKRLVEDLADSVEPLTVAKEGSQTQHADPREDQIRLLNNGISAELSKLERFLERRVRRFALPG